MLKQARKHLIAIFFLLVGFGAALFGLINLAPKEAVNMAALVVGYAGIISLLFWAGLTLCAYFIQLNEVENLKNEIQLLKTKGFEANVQEYVRQARAGYTLVGSEDPAALKEALRRLGVVLT